MPTPKIEDVLKWMHQIIFLIKSFCFCNNFYLGESKVLQYFGIVRHHVAASDAFAKVVKVTNNTGLRDTEFS